LPIDVNDEAIRRRVRISTVRLGLLLHQ